MATVDLLDVNAWLALSSTEHVHHRRARQYWMEEACPMVAFNSHTMLGLVRVSSTAPLFGGKPLSPENAWEIYLEWLQDPAVTHLSEQTNCRTYVNELVRQGVVTAGTWSDAYLAAFAMSRQMRLVSFDRDFFRYSSLEFLHLSSS